MDDFELEIKADFLVEAKDILADAESSFLELEKNPSSPEILDTILRLAHNLKGASRAVGFGCVAEFTHEFENFLLKIKDGGLKITPPVVDVLLKSNDHLGQMLEKLSVDVNSEVDSSELLEAFKTLVTTLQDGSNKEVESDDCENYSEEENVSIQEEVLTSSEINDQCEQELESLVFNYSENINSTAKKDNETKVKVGVKDDEDIRVSLKKIESLNNYVGELVILQTVLFQQGSKLHNPELNKSLSLLNKISKEIQDISMSLRMVPIKQTMRKMNRIVRDTSKALDKKVRLVLEGEDTEIDKTILGYLNDPLVHIIRNAVDHGIESPQERRAVNKSEDGTITLKAYHEGNSLVIEVSDDGKGIDVDHILVKAVEKGIISGGNQYSDDEILQLIFHPGFSTKDVASEVSGRGVGMDVVKTNLEKIGGNVSIETVKGEGSTFKIVLPLTMAIIYGLVVKIREERFVVPLDQIQEIIILQDGMMKKSGGNKDYLDLRGDVIPVFRTADKLKCRGEKQKEKIAIVIKTRMLPFAILVDDVIQQQQVVIKNIGAEIRHGQSFAGVSILGDGKPAFILDLQNLYRDEVRFKDVSA